MNKYGSDKGNGWHNYTKLYYKIFKDKRNDELNIFELGLGTNNINIPSTGSAATPVNEYVYDIERYVSGQAPENTVSRVLQGTVTVTPEVTY
jgi:hypothetical protein